MKIGTVIYALSACPSTNDVAKRLAQAGSEEGIVVMAEEQTAGRGTRGRAWHSPRGRGLYLSIILRPRRADLSLLPLLAGLACAEAMREATGLEVKLKWPNDVLWEGRKLGGILCESEYLGSRASFAIVGIGLNLDQRRSDFPEEFRAEATSIRLASGKTADRMAIERALFSALDRWYGLFRRGRKAEIVRAFELKLAVPVGKGVSVATEKGSLKGVFRGIDTRARFRLGRRGGGELRLSPAEILRVEDDLFL
jgi:BirA family biotin operon repressor/biotin-[acetyl-CoA-carboxylase] ligase